LLDAGLSSDTPRSDQAATKRSYPDEKRSVLGCLIVLGALAVSALHGAIAPATKCICELFINMNDVLSVPRVPLFYSREEKTDENVGYVVRKLKQQHVEKLFARL
jgi:hypothetical protein